MISKLGSGALQAKMDMKSAFLFVLIYQSDFDLLGFSINGLYYMDECLQMSCSISCKILETFAKF